MATADELVGAFTAAVPFALRELAGVEAIDLATGPASRAEPVELCATIRLDTSVGPWRMILCLSDATAAELARRILADAVVSTPELIQDCMGEVANVVAGQAKALLVGSPSHFYLSTPDVQTGGPVDGANGQMIRFGSEAGEFALGLYPPS
ncbi:MAG TPA: chemotaxis protein CheX [Gemmataceae bacterium]|jgi:CheY-specific phosphatase CheX|nr:chemotaxis protein CheX [Gemmataceae bacterium]